MRVATRTHTSAARMRFWQKAFTVINVILAIGFVVGGGLVVLLELLDAHEGVHRWHESELLALAVIVMGGTLVSMIWQPLTKPLLAQFFIIGVVATVACIAPFEPKAMAALLIAVLFIVAYPDKRALLSFSREGAVSKPLLGISILIAVFLLPTAWHEMQLQAIGMSTNDVHALVFHWAGSALLIVLLVVGGFLAATKRPGWKELGVIVGGTFCYLGLIAMTMPMQTGSWGGASGLYAISMGVWYILFTFLEARSSGQKKVAPAIKQGTLVEQRSVDQTRHDTRELVGVR